VTAAIVGATKAEHFSDALAAEQLALSDAEIARPEEPYTRCSGTGSGQTHAKERDYFGQRKAACQAQHRLAS
jgi:hypothetical protein